MFASFSVCCRHALNDNNLVLQSGRARGLFEEKMYQQTTLCWISAQDVIYLGEGQFMRLHSSQWLKMCEYYLHNCIMFLETESTLRTILIIWIGCVRGRRHVKQTGKEVLGTGLGHPCFRGFLMNNESINMIIPNHDFWPEESLGTLNRTVGVLMAIMKNELLTKHFSFWRPL